MEKLPSMKYLDELQITYDVKEVVIIKDTTEVGPKLGIDVNQAMKTLVVKGSSGKFYLCIIGAGQRLKIKKLKKIVDEQDIQMATSEEIQEQTGYAVGGVPAFSLKNKLIVFIETTLQQYDIIAVGAGKSGVEIMFSPQDLQKASEGNFVDIISTKNR